MATTKYLETKIVTCNDSSTNWGSSSKVLLRGEIAIEFPTTGTPKFKIGDGTRTFANLPYASMTPTEISSAIELASSHANKDILDAITAAYTTEEQTKLSGIETGAQVNVIESIAVNGTTQAINNKRVNIAVPTQVSDLENDAGYITSYVDHTYNLSASRNSTNGNVDVVLEGSDGTPGSSTTYSVRITGSGATTVTTDAQGVVTVDSTDTVYTHPESGVSAGTYTKVVVDSKGHVTSASSPTTLAGYGITDAASISHTHGNADITDLDASKITSGTISIDRLPAGALERLVIVADETAMLALTSSDVQVGDVVKCEDTGLMYFVKSEADLGTMDAFEEFTAGAATSVPWSGVTDKPTAFNPTTHTHTKSEITDFSDADYATAAQGTKADSAVQSVTIGSDETELNVNGVVNLPAYPTTLPASDVYDWAKASTKPTYTATEVGLGNVTNDAQIKGLASGTTAGHIVTFGNDGYTVQDSGFTIATSVPANAVFTDTTYTDFVGASASSAGDAGLVPAPAAGDNEKFLRGDGEWVAVDVEDTKVASTPDDTTKAYLVATTSANASTGSLIKDTGVYLDTTAGSLVATTFTGSLIGNASSATILQNSRNFSISGGATAAAVAFNGSSAVDLVVTSLDATKLNVAEGDTLIIDGGNSGVSA